MSKLAAVNVGAQAMIDGTGTDRHVIYKRGTADNWTIFGGIEVISSTPADTNWHIFTAVFNGASSFLRLDGTQIMAGNVGTAALVGTTTNSFANGLFEGGGDRGEQLTYNNEVNTANIAVIENYLSNKWGIAIA